MQKTHFSPRGMILVNLKSFLDVEVFFGFYSGKLLPAFFSSSVSEILASVVEYSMSMSVNWSGNIPKVF